MKVVFRSISLLKWSALFLVLFVLVTILSSLIHTVLWRWFVAKLR